MIPWRRKERHESPGRGESNRSKGRVRDGQTAKFDDGGSELGNGVAELCKEKRGTCSEQRGAFQWRKGEEDLEQGLYRERDDEFGRDSELGSRTSIRAVG